MSTGWLAMERRSAPCFTTRSGWGADELDLRYKTTSGKLWRISQRLAFWKDRKADKQLNLKCYSTWPAVLMSFICKYKMNSVRRLMQTFSGWEQKQANKYIFQEIKRIISVKSVHFSKALSGFEVPASKSFTFWTSGKKKTLLLALGKSKLFL